MSESNVGMLVELDYCVGCYACQSACQDKNKLPVKETYLRCILQKPEMLQGEMQCFMSPVPYDLDHCAQCIESECGVAPCAEICIGRALHFDDIEEICKKAASASGRVAVFM